MAENSNRERVEEVSSISPQIVHFDPKPFDTLYHVNRFKSVNFILDLECVSRLTVHGSPFRMAENLCRSWGHEKGVLLGWYGQGIVEPITAKEWRDHEGLDTIGNHVRMDTSA